MLTIASGGVSGHIIGKPSVLMQEESGVHVSHCACIKAGYSMNTIAKTTNRRLFDVLSAKRLCGPMEDDRMVGFLVEYNSNNLFQ